MINTCCLPPWWNQVETEENNCHTTLLCLPLWINHSFENNIQSHIDCVQRTKLKERKNILIITLLNPFQANILFLHRLTTSEHHRYNHLFSDIKTEMGLAKFIWTIKLRKILFKKITVQSFFWSFRCKNLKNWEPACLKKVF